MVYEYGGLKEWLGIQAGIAMIEFSMVNDGKLNGYKITNAHLDKNKLNID